MSAGALIVGGGLAGQRCAEALRRGDYDGPIRMISAEPHRPYDRPPLSKDLLLGACAEPPALRPAAWYSDHDVDLRLGVRATGLYPAARTLALSDGVRLPYDHLLIATGSRPLALPGLEARTNVTTLRTIEDAWRLRGAIARGARLAVVGAGFIGQEVAATARTAGCDVTLIEAMPWPLGHVLGHELGRWFAELHRDEGVRVVLDRRIAAVHGDVDVAALRLDDDTLVECDHVVVGIGVVPDLDWLKGSGLDAAWRRGRRSRGGRRARGVRGGRRGRGVRPSPATPRSRWPLGVRGAPGSAGRSGDPRPSDRPRAAAQLLERPVRHAHPADRPRRARGCRQHRRATRPRGTSPRSTPAGTDRSPRCSSAVRRRCPMRGD